MNTGRENLYPTVLKTVVLNTDELLRYRKQFRLAHSTKKHLAELVNSIMETQLEQEDAQWEELYAKFGYANYDAVLMDKRQMAIEWLEGVVVLRGKEGDTLEEKDTCQSGS